MRHHVGAMTSRLKRRAGSLRAARRWLPSLDYTKVHYCYFILTSLATSVVLWKSSTDSFRLGYVDSLFLAVSAMTEAGLNTVNLSQLNTWQQVILFLLILSGSTIWVSIWTVLGQRVFAKREMRPRSVEAGTRYPSQGYTTALGNEEISNRTARGGAKLSSPVQGSNSASLEAIGIPEPCRETDEKGCFNQDLINVSEVSGDNARKLNHECSVEYQALTLLTVVIPLYWGLWQLVGCVAIAAWIAQHEPGPVLANGINPWWLGIFNGVSAFNNSGMSLLDANMIPFQNAHFVLITMGLMILAGNTAYPIFLRLIFSAGLKMLRLFASEKTCKKWSPSFEFILRCPRRVYTHLFPARHTWWLLLVVISLNCIDWVAFELFNLGNPVITSIKPASRVLDGLFQAVAVRSGGFYVVPIANLNIGLQILYVIMMYISVYPVVITMRHSNVLEERSLGIYSTEPMEARPGFHHNKLLQPWSNANDRVHGETLPCATKFGSQSEPSRPCERNMHDCQCHQCHHEQRVGFLAESRFDFVSHQVRVQLAHDIWLLALAVLVIASIETDHFEAQPATYSVFNILFEVISAYGCVGISVGLPSEAYSFSGGWHGASKLVLCLVMLRGRHRGLPAALDRAIKFSHTEEYAS